MSRKLKVKSIQFTKKNVTDERLIKVVLNNGMRFEISKIGSNIQYRFLTLRRATKTEIDVACMVYKACWNYLNGDEPQSMDYEAVYYAKILAKERFDWKAAGYPESHEKGEQELFLSCKIALYEDV